MAIVNVYVTSTINLFSPYVEMPVQLLQAVIDNYLDPYNCLLTPTLKSNRESCKSSEKMQNVNVCVTDIYIYIMMV